MRNLLLKLKEFTHLRLKDFILNRILPKTKEQAPMSNVAQQVLSGIKTIGAGTVDEVIASIQQAAQSNPDEKFLVLGASGAAAALVKLEADAAKALADVQALRGVNVFSFEGLQDVFRLSADAASLQGDLKAVG